MDPLRKTAVCLLLIPLVTFVSAGFEPARNALTRLRQRLGNPCDCSGGYGYPQSGVSTLATVNCGDKIAYLPSNGDGQYSCYKSRSQLTTDQGSELPTCPAECATIHPLVHSSCYEAFQQCILNHTVYFTALLTRGTPIAAPYTHIQVAAPCGNTPGKSVCWLTNPPLHMSDGGGPADTNQATKIQEKLEEAHKALFSPLVYHPSVLPKPRGSVDIDAQTLDILTATHKLLNSSNPAFAGDCWLCLHQGTPTPLALPLPEKDFSATTLCGASSPFLVQPLHFTNVTCFASYSFNRADEVDLGDVSFANCTAFVNVSTPLCASNSSVFICGNNYAYTSLPQNWTGSCVLGYLLPDITMVPGDEPVPIPSLDHVAGRSKRAVAFVPLLIGLGVSGAVASGAAGLGHSIVQYQKISRQLITDVQASSETIQDSQDHVDSLAEVVLQNRRGLDLLTAEQGGICLALGEKCCFYANKSGIVRDKIKRLQEDLERRRKEITSNPFWSGMGGMLPYLLPLLGPLLGLLILLSLGPVLFQKLMTFIRQRIEALQAKPIQVHYTHVEMLERGDAYIHLGED